MIVIFILIGEKDSYTNPKRKSVISWIKSVLLDYEKIGELVQTPNQLVMVYLCPVSTFSVIQETDL